MFDLLDNEFTFDVDVSQIGCGLNGALYFVNMPAEGQGEAGAEYGLGYCDSQCPRDLKYIDGLVSTLLLFSSSCKNMLMHYPLVSGKR